MSRPSVIALTPAWNAEAFIEQTLRSLSRQTYQNLRVIISDDGSTDSTAAVCERFAAADERFEVIRQPRNLGWVGNSNELLRLAAGAKYAFFALHDDEPEPDYVERLADRLEANPNAVLAFSDMIETKPDGSRVVRIFDKLDGLTSPSERGLAILRNDWYWWVPFRGVFRTEPAIAAGGLRRHWAGEFGADWPWLLALALRGEFERVCEPLCTKRVLETSLSARWKYSAAAYTGVGFSCAREIRRSGLPLRAQLHLCGRLGRNLYRQWLHGMPENEFPVRVWRALGLKREWDDA